jgi:hypothetical protein
MNFKFNLGDWFSFHLGSSKTVEITEEPSGCPYLASLKQPQPQPEQPSTIEISAEDETTQKTAEIEADVVKNTPWLFHSSAKPTKEDLLRLHFDKIKASYRASSDVVVLSQVHAEALTEEQRDWLEKDDVKVIYFDGDTLFTAALVRSGYGRGYGGV